MSQTQTRIPAQNNIYQVFLDIIDKYDEFDSIKIREIALKSYSDNAYGNNIREAINSVISASN